VPRIASRFVLVLALTLAPAAIANARPDAGSLPRWSAAAYNGVNHPGNGTIPGAAPWLSGYFGPAFKLEGVSGRRVFPDDPSLEPASAVSVSIYVRARRSPGAYRYLVAKGAEACGGASYGMYSGPAGGLMFYVSQNDGLSFVRSPDAGSGIWDGRWHLAVGTYDGDAVHLYIDGSEIGVGAPLTGPIGYGLVGSNDLFFGRDGACPGTHFGGLIAEPTVWSRALSRLDVEAAYAARLAHGRGGNRPIGSAR
jgi:hypothetical protein